MTQTAPAERTRLLVVEDEPFIADLLASGLRFAGYQVRAAYSVTEAVPEIEEFQPHLLLLDVMLPDGDGFDVCRQVRRRDPDVGIIFLTARTDTQDTVAGLSAGGDDYITKPFSLDEVVARVRAVLRRLAPADGEQPQQAKITYADLELDEDLHEVRRGEHLIGLTPTEFKLLHYLMLNSGRVLSKAQILDHVWHYDFNGDARVVESYISYLRKKVDADRAPLIHTIRGVGYTLRTRG